VPAGTDSAEADLKPVRYAQPPPFLRPISPDALHALAIVPREQGVIQMAKKKTNEPVVVEAAPEVIATEVNEPASEATEAPAPTPKPKKAKKPKAATADITLEALAAKYLAHMEEVGKSAGTTFSYRLELITALDVLGKDTLLSALTPTQVLEFNTSDRVMRTRTGVAKARPTFVKTQRVLRLALQWAQDSGLIDAAPLPEQAATY
jgi:hypothetical protein